MNLNGHDADARHRHALEPDRHGVEQAEQEAGAKRLDRAPLGEDQGGERNEPLARGHVPDEAGALGKGEIGHRQIRTAGRSI